MKAHRIHWSRRVARALARTFAGAVVAGVLGAAALSVWVNGRLSPERLRPEIVSQLERTFQRRIDIDSVGVALHQGVRISGLRVYSRPGAPDPLFLTADLLVARYSLPALLQGRFVLTTVRLVNPRVSLYRKPDGRWNLEEILRTAERAESGGRFALPPLSAAEEIRLEGGTVRIVDASRSVDTTVRGVFLSVDDFSLESPFPCRVKLEGEGRFAGRTHQLKLEADLELMLAAFTDDERTAASVRRLKGSVDGRPFEATGKVRNLSLPDFDAKVSLPALSSDDLRQVSTRVPEGLSLPASSWELKVKTIPVSASTRTPSAFFLERLAGAAGPWRLEATGRLGADGALSGTLKTRSAPLARAGELFAPLAEHALAGTLDATLTVGGRAGGPRVTQWALDARGFSMTFWNNKRFTDTDVSIRAGERFRDAAIRVTRGSYVAYSNALSELDAEVRYSSGDLAVPRLNLTWNGSRLNLKGCVRDLHSWRTVAFEAEVDRLRVDETYTAIENLIAQRLAELGRLPQKDKPWAQTFRLAIPERFPDMAGRLRVGDVHSPNFSAQNLDLVLSLKDIAKELKTVSGHFQLGFGPGSMKNIVEMQKSHPLVNVLLIPYVELHKIRQRSRLSPETAVPTGLDFTRTFGDFTALGNGSVGVNFIHFDSRQFQAFAAGTADFPKDGVDLNVLMRMNEPAQNLPYHLTDTEGRLALDVSLVKDLNKPEVAFRGRKVGADDIEKGLSEGLKRVQPLPDLAEAAACRRGG